MIIIEKKLKDFKIVERYLKNMQLGYVNTVFSKDVYNQINFGEVAILGKSQLPPYKEWINIQLLKICNDNTVKNNSSGNKNHLCIKFSEKRYLIILKQFTIEQLEINIKRLEKLELFL